MSACRRPLSRDVERGRHIIRMHAHAHDLDYNELVGPRRFKALVEARFALYAKLAEAGFTQAEIGWLVGRRDHSTIAHGLAVYYASLDDDQAVAS